MCVQEIPAYPLREGENIISAAILESDDSTPQWEYWFQKSFTVNTPPPITVYSDEMIRTHRQLRYLEKPWSRSHCGRQLELVLLFSNVGASVFSSFLPPLQCSGLILQPKINLLLNQIEPLAAASQRKLASSVKTILDPVDWYEFIQCAIGFSCKLVIFCQLKSNKVCAGS